VRHAAPSSMKARRPGTSLSLLHRCHLRPFRRKRISNAILSKGHMVTDLLVGVSRKLERPPPPPLIAPRPNSGRAAAQLRSSILHMAASSLTVLDSIGGPEGLPPSKDLSRA